MKLKLELNIDNAAFDDGGEIARILREVGECIEDTETLKHPRTPIRDINGNFVGWYEVK